MEFVLISSFSPLPFRRPLDRLPASACSTASRRAPLSASASTSLADCCAAICPAGGKPDQSYTPTTSTLRGSGGEGTERPAHSNQPDTETTTSATVRPSHQRLAAPPLGLSAPSSVDRSIALSLDSFRFLSRHSTQRGGGGCAHREAAAAAAAESRKQQRGPFVSLRVLSTTQIRNRATLAAACACSQPARHLY